MDDATAGQPTLLPPEAFEDETTTEHGCASHHLVKRVFATRCGGITPRPTGEDLARAMTAHTEHKLRAVERIALTTWLAEASTEELVRVYADGGYSMGALVSAMQRFGAGRSHDPYRVRTLNTHCRTEWIEERNRRDPGAESHARPQGRF